TDRAFALMMLTRIFQEADGLIRDRERADTESDLTYMRSRLDQTQNVGYRQIFLDNIAELERKLMILQGDRPYAVKVFDGPSAPLQPTERRPLLYCVIAVAVGFVLGLLLAVLGAMKPGAEYVPRWPGSRLANSLYMKAKNVRRLRPAGRPSTVKRHT